MPTPSQPVRALPTKYSVEYLKKQAKRLLAAAHAGDRDALARIAAQLPASRRAQVAANSAALRLTTVQFALAREYGYASWRQFHSLYEQPTASSSTPTSDQQPSLPNENPNAAQSPIQTEENLTPITPEETRAWAHDMADAMLHMMSMMDCLDTAANKQSNPLFRELLSGVRVIVENGYPLSNALQISGGYLWEKSGLITVVRYGEMYGELEEVLLRYANECQYP